MQDHVTTYRTRSDDDLILIHADFVNLTPEAREALRAEMESRGLTEDHATAKQQQWKQEAEDEIKARNEERTKRRVGWDKIAAQVGIVVAVAVLFVTIVGSLGHWSEEAYQSLGALTADAAFLSLGITLGFLRGRLFATITTTVGVYILAAVWMFH